MAYYYPIEFPAVSGNPYYKILNIINDHWVKTFGPRISMTKYHTQATCFSTKEEALQYIDFLKQKDI